MLSDDGAKIVRAILQEIESGVRLLPGEISLKDLEEKTRIRPSNIGKAFDGYIKAPLLKRGIAAVKCGKPVRIQLKKAQPEHTGTNHEKQ